LTHLYQSCSIVNTNPKLLNINTFIDHWHNAIEQNSSYDVEGADVRRLFIERSSIIREPIVGIIDFTHRTFQEFLAALAILDEKDISMLVQNAHNDQWLASET